MVFNDFTNDERLLKQQPKYPTKNISDKTYNEPVRFNATSARIGVSEPAKIGEPGYVWSPLKERTKAWRLALQCAIVKRVLKVIRYEPYTGSVDLKKLSLNLARVVKKAAAARVRYTDNPIGNLKWFKQGDITAKLSRAVQKQSPDSKQVVFKEPVFLDFKYLRSMQQIIFRFVRSKRHLYTRINPKFENCGPQRLLTPFLPEVVETAYFKIKNFYRRRFSQSPPGQDHRQKILEHFYLKYSRYALFFKSTKRRDITSNFFSFDRKLLKLYAHQTEKFVYKRYPYLTQKYNTSFYFPDYNNYRFLFKNQIRAQHTFRWIYRLSYKQLVKIYKKTIYYTKRRFEFVFLKYLELRLDTVVYRLNIAFSLKQGRQWVKKGLFLVNNRTMTWPRYQVSVGDVVRPILLITTHRWPQQNWTIDFGQIYNSTRLFWRPIQIDQYPAHFMINERIPAGLVVTTPNPHKVYHTRPLSIQFLTLSLLKYS